MDDAPFINTFKDACLNLKCTQKAHFRERSTEPQLDFTAEIHVHTKEQCLPRLQDLNHTGFPTVWNCNKWSIGLTPRTCPKQARMELRQVQCRKLLLGQLVRLRWGYYPIGTWNQAHLSPIPWLQALLQMIHTVIQVCWQTPWHRDHSPVRSATDVCNVSSATHKVVCS